MTNLHNYSDAQIADEIGSLDREMKALKKRLDAAKGELKVRGIEEATGDVYAVKVTVTTRKSLDTSAIKTSFGEEVLAQFQKFADVFSVRISAA